MTNEQIPETPEKDSAALRAFDRVFDIIQFVCLCAIALAAVIGFGTELWHMLTTDRVVLGDLLMLFLYTEVMVMARAALHSNHELAVLMPITIAVVALGRYMVVSSDHNALNQVLFAGAVFILVSAFFLWKLSTRGELFAFLRKRCPSKCDE